MLIPWDSIQLKLTEQETVTTDTVRVNVKATLSVTPEQAERVKTTLEEALAKILETRWEISKALRREDAAGMEQVMAIATVRVKEAAASGLVARLQQASRSGFKLELLDIDYRSPREAIDAAKQRLRKLVYQRAVEEAAVVNQTVVDAGRQWHVHEIQIVERVEDNRLREEMTRNEKVAQMAYRHTSASILGNAEDENEGSPDLSVGGKVVVEGTVTLQRPSVTPPEGGFFSVTPRA
ncbi:MAG: hypothetical protein ACOYN0_17355 [Phycisphaerales bacterium]